MAEDFHTELIYHAKPNITQPKLVRMFSKNWPTAIRFQTSLTERQFNDMRWYEINILRPCEFARGDGVVTIESAKMAEGWESEEVETTGKIFKDYNFCFLCKGALSINSFAFFSFISHTYLYNILSEINHPYFRSVC